MSDTFLKIPGMQQKLKWAKIWFEQFVRFHQQHNNAKSWRFSSDDVIDVSKFDISNGLLGFESKTVANAKTANGANRIGKKTNARTAGLTFCVNAVSRYFPLGKRDVLVGNGRALKEE